MFETTEQVFEMLHGAAIDALERMEAERDTMRARAEAAEAEAARSAKFLGECGYLVGIEVYSPDDIPVIAERLGALHTRAEAAEARGAAAERAAVVAWLRANVAQRVLSLHDTIACIERGEHCNGA